MAKLSFSNSFTASIVLQLQERSSNNTLFEVVLFPVMLIIASPVILIFGIVVFSHELGHFLLARRGGIQVNEFTIGMGPVIWKKQGKTTVYSLRLFPIGGACMFEGEDGNILDIATPVYNHAV